MTKELACVKLLATGDKRSQSSRVLHIYRRLAAGWDKLGGQARQGTLEPRKFPGSPKLGNETTRG